MLRTGSAYTYVSPFPPPFLVFECLCTETNDVDLVEYLHELDFGSVVASTDLHLVSEDEDLHEPCIL